MALRTIVIAPKTDLLLVDAEVAAVVNYLRASLLNGELSVDDVLNKLAAEQWDVIWFAAHGDEKGIHLVNAKGEKELLSVPLLTSFIRTAGASLVVFNTCSSYQVAQMIYNELLIDFVCTIRPIPDRDAFFTGKSFAIHLGRGKSPHDAYLAAKLGGNTDYIFINKRETPVPPAAASSVEIQMLSEDVRRLSRLIDGDPQNKEAEPGLRAMVRNQGEELATLRVEVRFLRFGMWIMAGSSVLIAIILIGILLTGGAP